MYVSPNSGTGQNVQRWGYTMPNTFLLEFANSIYNWVIKVSVQLFLSFGTSYFGYPVIRNPSISVESTLKSSIVSYLPLGHNSKRPVLISTSWPLYQCPTSSQHIRFGDIERSMHSFTYTYLLLTSGFRRVLDYTFNYSPSS